MMPIHELCRVAGLCFKNASSIGHVGCHRTLTSLGGTVQPPASGMQKIIENLWRGFFYDPSQWSDHRLEKDNPKFPDFKHKKTHEGLWVDGISNPPWVKVELAAIPPQKGIYLWNKAIAKLVEAKKYKRALEAFQEMQLKGISPNRFTFVPVLRACANLRVLEQGRQIHELIARVEGKSDVFVDSCLVDMYAKCGSITEARSLFEKMSVKNLFSWSAMLLGYVKCGEAHKALELFEKMKMEGVDPDGVIFVGLLKACSSLGLLHAGRRIHKEILRRGYDCNIYVCNSLIDMYAKCGSIENARIVFNAMRRRSVLSWSVMITGYVKSGDGQRGLELYKECLQKGVALDYLTFVGVLNACASIGALTEGRQVHEQVIQNGYKSDIFVATSLVDMYAKCGSMEDAENVFETMPRRSVVSWNALLGGYAVHGHANKALQHFARMHEKGVEVDKVTFVSLLSACNHGRFVDEGLHMFESMKALHKISPTTKHYTCIVDLLGRVGRLHEAEDLIRSMSCEATVTTWMSLASSCRVHGNKELGEKAGKQVVDLECENSRCTALQAVATKRDSSLALPQRRVGRVAKHIAWIEVNNLVHSFTAENCRHPQIGEIMAELKRLARTMEGDDYVPDNISVVHNVDDGSRQIYLCNHSETVAIAFGLISSPPGTPLQVFKNLGICGSCHAAIKWISKIVGREIIVRDSNRFHHFQDGNCSCQDYL